MGGFRLDELKRRIAMTAEDRKDKEIEDLRERIEELTRESKGLKRDLEAYKENAESWRRQAQAFILWAYRDVREVEQSAYARGEAKDSRRVQREAQEKCLKSIGDTLWEFDFVEWKKRQVVGEPHEIKAKVRVIGPDEYRKLMGIARGGLRFGK